METLAKFGIEVTQRTKASAEATAVRVAKGKATRAQKQAATPVPAQPKVVIYGADGQPIGPVTPPVAPAAIPPASGSSQSGK